MSGGVAQLLAIGAQDSHLVGNPQASYFRSTFKRHTNFSQSVESQTIQGNVQNGGISSVRFERKGDLLSYIYLQPTTKTASPSANVAITDWTKAISKVSLYIGGQLIDEQDSTFSTLIAPKLCAQTYAKSRASGLFGSGSAFYPIRFFNSESFQDCIPLISCQYHDVEIRITWGSEAEASAWTCYANFIFLDTDEREYFASTKQDIVITQVTKCVASAARIQELNFNHPVKAIAAANTGGVNLVGSTNRLKLQINGTDIGDYRYAHPNYTSVPLFYHTSFGDNDSLDDLFVYSFGLDVSKPFSTGTLNFSRLDSARIVSETATSNDNIYAIGLNILRFENGLAGLLYSS